jgi:RNA polymerase primary sigma factor
MRQLKITKSITNREQVSVEKYLSDIAKIPMLTPEEEVELSHKIKDGDHHALELLTQANLRFVVSVAKQYQNNGLSLSDLINEGNVGLIKAANRFDASKGFKFISYAVWWIRQSILQAIVDYSRLVRMPVNKLTSYNKVSQTITELIQKLEREPTTEELAEHLEIPIKNVEYIIQSFRNHVSIDAPLGEEDDGGSLIDVLIQDSEFLPDERIISQSLSEEMQKGLAALTHREFSILERFYGLGERSAESLDEIAQDFNLTRERVRQLKDKSIRRLKRVYMANIVKGKK